MLVPGLRPVDADADAAEDLLHGQRPDEVRGDGAWSGCRSCPWRSSWAPERKALRQVPFSAPKPICSKASACRVRASAWVSSANSTWLQHLDDPAVVALVVGPAGHGHRRVRAAHGGDVPRGGLDRRVRPQVGGVGVVPAHVALVDGLHVVADRPVVAVGVPGRFERGRHLQHLGDLGADVALVHESQRLVVQVGVHVALHGQELDRPLTAPGGPVVRREHHVELAAPQVDRLGEVVRPTPARRGPRRRGW